MANEVSQEAESSTLLGFYEAWDVAEASKSSASCLHPEPASESQGPPAKRRKKKSRRKREKNTKIDVKQEEEENGQDKADTANKLKKECPVEFQIYSDSDTEASSVDPAEPEDKEGRGLFRFF